MKEQFLPFGHHFAKLKRPSKESSVLLLLDNYSAYLTVNVIKCAKQNGVVCLSFPPHTSHRLQGIDIYTYGPLKKYVALAQNCWVKTHPGKVMTIHDLPTIAKEALLKANTPWT